MVFGAAAVTLFAVGAILAGPAMVDCAGQSDFGACVRDGLTERGLLAPRGPELHAEIPAPPREDPRGFLDAQAAELPPMPPVPVVLEELPELEGMVVDAPPLAPALASVAASSPGTVGTTVAANVPEPPAAIDLAEQTGALSATASSVPAGGATSASLSPVGATIVAREAAPAAIKSVDVALVAPALSNLSVAIGTGASPAAAATGFADAVGEVGATGSPGVRQAAVGASIAASSGALSGSSASHAAATSPGLELRPVEPAPLLADARVPAPANASPAALSPIVEAPAPPEPQPPAIRFNPDYPNVLVLPPPLVGENSAFVLLQLD